MLSLRITVILITGMLMFTSLGRGANAPVKAQAKALRIEGDSLRATGRLGEALVRYQAAYALVPTPLLHWRIAQVHLELGQPEEGLRALALYEEGVPSEQMPPGQGPAEVSALRQKLEALRQRPTAASTNAVAPRPALDLRRTEARQRQPRPPWRLWTGGVAVAAGVVLGGFGVSALAVHGGCATMPSMEGRCAQSYDTVAPGAGLLSAGLVLALGGVGLLLWPGPTKVQP